MYWIGKYSSQSAATCRWATFENWSGSKSLADDDVFSVVLVVVVVDLEL